MGDLLESLMNIKVVIRKHRLIWNFKLKALDLSVRMHSCNPSIQEADSGGLRIDARLGCMWSSRTF